LDPVALPPPPKKEPVSSNSRGYVDISFGPAYPDLLGGTSFFSDAVALELVYARLDAGAQ